MYRIFCLGAYAEIPFFEKITKAIVHGSFKNGGNKILQFFM